MRGGVLRGDAVGLERGDDQPIGSVFNVRDEDLSAPQARGLATGDGSGRKGADLLDNRVPSGSRDGQDRGRRLLTQALGRECTDSPEARLGVDLRV